MMKILQPMKLNYQTKVGKLYTSTGEAVLPDEKGIVTVTIEGSTRRFMMDKFIAKLESGTVIKLANVVGKVGNRRGWAEPAPKPKPKEKKVKLPKPAKSQSSKAIVAMDKNGNKQTFSTQRKAAEALGLTTGGICNQIKGVYLQMNGYVFWKEGEPEKEFPKKHGNLRPKPVEFKPLDGAWQEADSVTAAANIIGSSKAAVSKAISRNRPTHGYLVKFKTA